MAARSYGVSLDGQGCVLLNLDRSKGSRMPAQLELAAKVLRCQFLFSDLATQLDGGQGLTNQDLSKGSRIPTQLELSDLRCQCCSTKT